MASKDALTSMTVSLPASQKEYIRERSASTGCSTPSEYVRRLIHADQKEQRQQALETTLLAGLDSSAREMTAKEWAKLREKLRGELRKKRR
jgi:Arc/MetJ-type ribon-helix-helix transcriptional regulator